MNQDASWQRDARQARLLSWLSLSFMAAEGAIAITAAVIAGSVALHGLRAPDITGLGPVGPLLSPFIPGGGEAAGALMLMAGAGWVDSYLPLMAIGIPPWQAWLRSFRCAAGSVGSSAAVITD